MSVRTLRTRRVPVKQLRRVCDPARFKFKTTAELEPIGRARSARTAPSARWTSA